MLKRFCEKSCLKFHSLLKGLVFATLLFIGFNSNAQAKENIDTLIARINDIEYIYPDSCLDMLNDIEFDRGDELNSRQLIKVFNLRADIYWSLHQMNTSILFYKKALEVAEESNDSLRTVLICANIGYVFSDQGKNDSAIFYLHKSIELAEKFQLEEAGNRSQTFLGHCYENSNRFSEALEIYESLIGYYIERDSKNNVYTMYISIATCHQAIGNLDTAKYYYELILDDTDYHVASNLSGLVKMNLAGVYSDLNDFEKAEKLVAESKSMFLEIGNPAYFNSAVIIEGDIHVKQGNYNKGILFYEEALENAIELQDLRRQSKILSKLKESYKDLKDFKTAFSYQERLLKMEDSIRSIQNDDFVSDMEAKYQSEKKEKEISLLNKDKELNKVELEKTNALVDRANSQKVLFVVGIVVLIIIILFIIVGLRQKQKANAILTSQKIQIEEKNREIVDSINYAKRIQAAILPPVKLFDSLLPESFVLYKPKDIVAGDFYWLEQHAGKVYFAAADCTGHGVPGALVSVICSNALTKALIEEGVSEPGKLFDRTRELVIEKFGKSEEEIKDGMDISLCAFDPVKRTLEWAGANNPLWLLRSGKEDFEIYKPDKQPIGKYGVEKPFTNHSLHLEKGDQLYIFTDGFQDQFGNEDVSGRDGGKKYKPSRLKKFLLAQKSKDLQSQKEELIQEFDCWKGDLEQVDDVCMIGVRF